MDRGKLHEVARARLFRGVHHIRFQLRLPGIDGAEEEDFVDVFHRSIERAAIIEIAAHELHVRREKLFGLHRIAHQRPRRLAQRRKLLQYFDSIGSRSPGDEDHECSFP
jgi:hypothetical protein